MPAPPPALLDPLFADAAMDGVFGDLGRLQGMLDFEAALAHALAQAGRIPEHAARCIGQACAAERYDAAALGQAARSAGNLAIPLIKALTAEVARIDAQAARHVHRGSTSQDAIDTGLVLRMRDALDLLDRQLESAISAAAALARTHRRSVMPGRTWLQQAVPITFGLKAAGWLDALLRIRERLRELRPRVLVLQFGGAAGSLSALGDDGLRVAEALAERLRLGMPAIPWHTHRDRIAETGAILGLLAGALGKIATDVSLLMQNEIAEAFEPAEPGRGGSSTMPQKRNPVACSVAIAAATRVPGLIATLYAAMPQQHERGLGSWPAEWECLPEIFRLVAGSLAHVGPMLAGLEVSAASMRAHCESGNGLLYAEAVSVALAQHLGKAAAHAAVEEACRKVAEQGWHLYEVLVADSQVVGHLDADRLGKLFDPENCLGSNDLLIDRVLERMRHRDQN